MMFFFKKKPIVIDCFTNQPKLLEMACVRKTHNYIPSWWKDLPGAFRFENDFFDSPTMKHCTGFINWYTNGFTIPMWTDLAIVIGSKTEGGYKFQYADGNSRASDHSANQYGHIYPTNEFQHLKLSSPWMFTCKEDIKFAFVEHTWNILSFKSFRIMPGILDFKYQPSTNINLMFPRTDTSQELLIPFNEPLVQIIPLSDRKIKLNVHADPMKYRALNGRFTVSKFTKEYLTTSKLRKGL